MFNSTSNVSAITEGFETGDFTNWTITGNASIKTDSFGIDPTEGTYQALITSGEKSINDSQIETKLGLTSGTLDSLGNGNATEGTILQSMTFTVKAGDSLSFDWNYLTQEMPNGYYNDFGFVAFSNGEVFTLANTKSDLTLNWSGDFWYETGFETFEYTFSEGGTYTLALGMMDVGDSMVDSGLLVDNLVINITPDFEFFGFETGDFTNWKATGNATIKTDQFGVNPTEGTYQALITSGKGSISDSKIESQLGLNKGTLDKLGNGNATEGSVLEFIDFTVSAGESISFDWDYLTGESKNSYYNDFGFVAFSNGDVVTLANTKNQLKPNTSNNQDFFYETGYKTFDYTFTTGGTYSMAIGIMDVGDTVVDSGLLIDNLIIGADIA